MSVDHRHTSDAQNAGDILKAARIAAGFSLGEVSHRLKLSARLLDAIEADDRTKLPEAVYVRGYVRNYARLLRLDPEPLLKDYHLGEAQPFHQESGVPPRQYERRPRRKAKTILITGFVIGLIVLFVVWQWPTGSLTDIRGLVPAAQTATPFGTSAQQPIESADVPASGAGGSDAPAFSEGATLETAEETEQTEEREEDEAAVALAEPLFSGRVANENESESVNEQTEAELGREAAVLDGEFGEDGAQDTIVVLDIGPEDLMPEPSMPEALPSLVDGETLTVLGVGEDTQRVQRLTVEGDDELVLACVEDSWVEVDNTQGERLYEDLLQRGETVRLLGSGPFHVKLGYAPGVTVRFNGEPIPLVPHTRENIASLVLGQ